jgi:beta-phosphoglucomutase-like phosphatase (HAD superfamily)
VTTPPAAIIFDCDGVLVDSERLMNREFSAMLNEIGLPYTPEATTRKFMGRSMKSCMEIVEAELGQPAPDGFLTALDTRAYAAFTRDLVPVSGITTLLDLLDHTDTPYAVASSGSHEKMRTTLGLTGLLPRLSGRITSATEVAHGKPAPDVFLLAAERLGVPPHHCVVIEDSLLGIEAALAATMRVVGYAAMIEPSEMQRAGATWITNDMLAIPALLGIR